MPKNIHEITITNFGPLEQNEVTDRMMAALDGAFCKKDCDGESCPHEWVMRVTVAGHGGQGG